MSDSVVTTYHGSKNKITKDSFHHSHLVGGHDQRGPGWYTTTDHEEAAGYGPHLHHVRLDTTHFITPKTKVKRRVIHDMVHNSPHLEHAASNYDEDHKTGVKKLIHSICKAPNMHEAMERTWYDAYRADNESFLNNASLHYHGTAVKPHGSGHSKTHFIVWNKSAIKSIHHNLDESHDHKMGDRVSYGGRMHYVRKVKDDELWIRGPQDRTVTKVKPDQVQKWEKKETPKASNGTCQICGNSFGTKLGIIAHHGYRRPGGGWQTASCEGAKHLPFEKSRDVLGNHIEQLHRTRDFHASEADRHKKDHGQPIDKLEHYRDAYGNKAQKVVTYQPDHPMYARHKKDVLDYHTGQTRAHEHAIEHQTKRYDSWKKIDESKRGINRAAKLVGYLAKRWEKKGSPPNTVDHSNYEDNDQIGRKLLGHKYIKAKVYGLDESTARSYGTLDKPVLSPQKLAKKHSWSIRSIISQLKAGTKVEKEHTSRESVARRIAAAHVGERPDYYTVLKKIDENVVRDDQVLNFVKKLNQRSEKTGIKNSGDGTFKFSHKYKDWPKKKEPDDIYDYDLAGAMNKAKKSPPKKVSLKGIVHTQPGVGFHAPEDVIKQKVKDDSPIEVVKHKGKKYLWDGHHRDFIARIRGDKMTKAHVVDTSKLEKRA